MIFSVLNVTEGECGDHRVMFTLSAAHWEMGSPGERRWRISLIDDLGTSALYWAAFGE
jgi:hypothetical protein